MENPYQTSPHLHDSPPPSGAITPGIIQALGRTKPCVRFCSVMGFIFTGFSVLFGGIMVVGGAYNGISNQWAIQDSVLPIMMGVISIAFSVMYCISAIKLWKYADAIQRLLGSHSSQDLQAALHQQRGFWVGACVMVILMVVSVLSVMTLAIFSSSI